MRLPNNIVLHQEGAVLLSKELKKFIDNNNPKLGIERTKVQNGNFVLVYGGDEQPEDNIKIRQSKITSVLYMIQAEIEFSRYVKSKNDEW